MVAAKQKGPAHRPFSTRFFAPCRTGRLVQQTVRRFHIAVNWDSYIAKSRRKLKKCRAIWGRGQSDREEVIAKRECNALAIRSLARMD